MVTEALTFVSLPLATFSHLLIVCSPASLSMHLISAEYPSGVLLSGVFWGTEKKRPYWTSQCLLLSLMFLLFSLWTNVAGAFHLHSTYVLLRTLSLAYYEILVASQAPGFLGHSPLPISWSWQPSVALAGLSPLSCWWLLYHPLFALGDLLDFQDWHWTFYPGQSWLWGLSLFHEQIEEGDQCRSSKT